MVTRVLNLPAASSLLLLLLGVGAACNDRAEQPTATTGGQAGAGASGGGAASGGQSGNGAAGDATGGTAGAPTTGGGTKDPTCPTGIEASDQAASAWDWVGIVGTGQSLSVGTSPITSTTQPYDNLMLSLGEATVPPWDASDPSLAMVPLVEPLRRLHSGYPAPYPGNLWGETPHSAMANELTRLVKCPDAALNYVTVHTVVGESGQGLVALEKHDGDTTDTIGRAYAATLFEAEAITRLAAEAGRTYGVGAIVMTHGETDSGSSTYKAGLIQLREDYQADLAAITGQTATIPMYLSQQHAYPNSGVGGRPVSNLTVWELGVEQPGDFVCTGPKYQYPGHENGDGVHLSALGYQLLGEKTAQIHYERAVLGRDWQPLQPTGVERDGRVVTVHFHVPVPPLTWDDSLDTPRIAEWADGRGFELRGGSTRLAIASVAIVGDSVQITARDELPATGLRVGYALSAQGEQMTTASFAVRWGMLRDSDPFVGATSGRPNPNYGISFELPVP